MTTAYKNAQLQLTTSYQTIYTAPLTVTSATITFGVCSNVSDTTNLNLHNVKIATTTSNLNKFITDRVVSKYSSDPLDEIVGAVLSPGDFITAKADANSSLNIRLSIKEITA